MNGQALDSISWRKQFISITLNQYFNYLVNYWYVLWMLCAEVILTTQMTNSKSVSRK